MTVHLSGLDEQRLLRFTDQVPSDTDGLRTWYIRLQHVLIAWSESASSPAILRHDGPGEGLVVFPDTGATLTSNDLQTVVPGPSVCVLPPGSTQIAVHGSGRIIRFLAPVPEALASQAINRDVYHEPRANAKALEPFERIGPPAIHVYPLARVRAGQRAKPRCFQTASMSIMWLDQFGPQDRMQLFPHAHGDFEEGALVVEGQYLQHLRTPWGNDSELWREDEHLICQPGALLVIPPRVIHTTAAIGEGEHALINVFAPVRRDHIESGMVLNAAEYRPREQT